MKTSEANALDNNPIWQAFKRCEEIQRRIDFKWREASDVYPEDLTKYPEDYRIKPLEFPAPPEGRAWHNPQNLTPEQVGVKDGWRLFLVEEKQHEGYQFYIKCLDSFSLGYMCGPTCEEWNKNTTLRTKAPLPIECPFKIGDTIQRVEAGMEKYIYTISDIFDGYVYFGTYGRDPISSMSLYRLYIPEYTIQEAIREARSKDLYFRPISYRGTGFYCYDCEGGFRSNGRFIATEDVLGKWEVVSSKVVVDEKLKL